MLLGTQRGCGGRDDSDILLTAVMRGCGGRDDSDVLLIGSYQ